MTTEALQRARAHVNDTRYRPDQRTGHYECYFVRANHPQRPLAFWIRYTSFSPRNHPEQAEGELWAIYFDGETGRNTAIRRALPFSECRFGGASLSIHTSLSIHIGNARLEPGTLVGALANDHHTMEWDLAFSGVADPLFLLPLSSYDASPSQAKALVALPFATFGGTLTIDSTIVEVENWAGSQNHNWGAKHSDHYAWGQVAGFDDAPDAFLEVVTVRRKVGPLWTPFATLLVLRREGQEIALNSAMQMWRARGSFDRLAWSFDTSDGDIRIAGRITAPAGAFVGLQYRNPRSGTKCCYNTKIASCELSLS